MYHNSMRIHFVGGTNLSMSGLALLLHSRGFTVSLSDQQPQHEMLQDLADRGCTVFKGYHAKHIGNADVVVYTPGTSGKNPELQAARAANIPTLPSGQLLAEVVRHLYSITVTGVHSKTSVAAIIGHLLRDNKWHPTIVTKGIMRNGNRHVHHGHSEWAVVTVDNDDDSLAHLQPTIALITNLKDLPDNDEHESIYTPYLCHLRQLPFYGTAVFCHDDVPARNLRRLWQGNTLTYGLSAHADVRGHIIDATATHTIFNLSDTKNGLLGTFRMPLPGTHQVVNALGAIAVCHYILCIPLDRIRKSLERFRGIARHFSLVGSVKKAAIIDDGACHPTQLDTTLLTARTQKYRHLHVVFQLPLITKNHQWWELLLNIFLKHDAHISTLHIVPPKEFSDDSQTTNPADLFAIDLSDKTKKLSLFCYQQFSDVVASIESSTSAGDLVVCIGAHGAHTIATTLAE